MKNFAWALPVCFAFVVGCSQGAPADEGGDEGALENGGGTAAPTAAVAIRTLSIEDSKPARNIDPTFSDMKTCETNIDYVVVSGTGHDDEINAHLKSGNTASATCEDPESVDSHASVVFNNKGFLSVAESGSYYAAGAAHPSHGTTYKNIDVTSGKLLKLSDIVSAAGKDTLLRSVRAQIGVQKMDGQKLDADMKSSLLAAASSSLGNLDGVDFAIANNGIRIDITNNLPHALQALDGVYLVKWKTLDAALSPALKARLTAK